MTEILHIQSIDVSAGFLLLLGLVVGVLSGLLGVGGGVLLTPALHILGMPMPLAVGTTLSQMVASSFTGAYKHFTQGNIIPALALIFGLPALLGVWLGRQLMVHWDELGRADAWTSLLYVGLLLYIGYNMLRKTRAMQVREKLGPDHDRQPKATLMRRLWFLGPRLKFGGFEQLPLLTPMALGFLVGMISSLTGLGGGFFYVPVMVGFAGLAITQAVGTSLLCVFMGSVVGAIAYFQADLVDVPVAVFLAIGSSVGGVVGANATKYARAYSLRYLFAFLVWMAAVSMMLRRSGYLDLSYYLLLSAALIVFFAAVFNTVFHYYSSPKKTI